MITLNKNVPTHFMLDPFFNAPRKRALKPVVNKNIAYNVLKSKDGFTLEFAAPGFSKDDFAINMEDGKLVVKLNKEVNSEVKYVSREFDFSSFEKKFTLPQDINLDLISASYDLGVLKISLPLKEKITKEISIL